MMRRAVHYKPRAYIILTVAVRGSPDGGREGARVKQEGVSGLHVLGLENST